MCLQLGEKELGHGVYALVQMLPPILLVQTHKAGLKKPPCSCCRGAYCIKLNSFSSFLKMNPSPLCHTLKI